jgi:hypothetical protein
VSNSRRKQEHVATDWIFELRDGIRRFHDPRIAWMFEVIKKLGRVHITILDDYHHFTMQKAETGSQKAEGIGQEVLSRAKTKAESFYSPI